MEILTVENLTFSYPGGAKTLDNVSFTLEEGDFAVLCGATGSGKSTLLRLCKRQLSPLGEKTGKILYKNTSIDQLTDIDAAQKIGFVMQKPEQQIVCDKVWHELAFGLENLNMPQNDIASRVAEMASYFGIESWYEKNVSELSGGQKQLLNLASVMVMDPDILILDEPTSQLDPIAAMDFIHTLRRLNRDFNLTILIVEHRLEDLIPICDKMILLDGGKIIGCDSPVKIVSRLDRTSIMAGAMPVAARVWYGIGPSDDIDCPLSVKDGRKWLEKKGFKNIKAPQEGFKNQKNINVQHTEQKFEPVLAFHHVYFKYSRELPDAVNDLDFTVNKGEVFCILGGNGSGKTTTLGLAAGIYKPYSGYISVLDKKLKEYKNQSLYNNCISMLPQDVQTVFIRDTVREELKDAGVDEKILPFDLSRLYDMHPYDLSGGQQQMVALAKVLATNPKILLMDEPTKGLDAEKKFIILNIIKKLKKTGTTFIIVTHDVEFAALCADRVALFFRGKIVSTATPERFFAENKFYTTAARRMSKGFFEEAVTADRIIEMCRKELETGNR